jgi:NUMOD3 motif
MIPRHLGGTDEPCNLLRCNISMHAFLHKCLWERYGHWQDKLAWLGLSGRISKEEIIIEKIKLANTGRKDSLYRIEQKRKFMIENNPMKNPITAKKISDMWKGITKLSSLGNNSRKGIKDSAEIRLKKSIAQRGEKNHFFGKKHSEETKLKISLTKKKNREENIS